MRRMMLATLVLLAMPTSAVTQTTALDCASPAPPLMGYDDAMMQEYRDEIGLEYSDYFTLAGQYLRCLEAAKSAVSAEIQVAIDAYNRLPTKSSPP